MINSLEETDTTQKFVNLDFNDFFTILIDAVHSNILEEVDTEEGSKPTLQPHVTFEEGFALAKFLKREIQSADNFCTEAN